MDEDEECEPGIEDCLDDCTFPRNVAFVTSTTFIAGTLGGLAGADAECQALADAAGLEGEFRAWLSDSTNDAVDRLAGARGWVRTDGLPFVDEIEDLVAGDIWYPLLVDETGTPDTDERSVITGTNAAGTLEGPTCDDWTNPAAPQNFTRGLNDHNARFWTDAGSVGCSASLGLYCFGIDYDHEVSIDVPDDARRAFVSSQAFPPGIGIAGADAVCNANATDAGLPGTYLALLAPDGATAMSRFSTDGGPWISPNGALFAATAQQFADDARLSPFGFTADGTPVDLNVYIWSGAATTDDAGSIDNGCEDWMVTTGFGQGTLTIDMGVLRDPWFGTIYPPCDNAYARLFCMQE